jgi:peptidoglycan/xylan/chitin deacetylase (PgdA/CDA1 family)
MSDQYCKTWPGKATAAAAFCFDLDAESAILSIAPQAASRMSVMTHQSYGPLVGVPRLLRLLECHGVKATFFVPGYTAHRYPDVVRAIAAEGHELAHHGYLHEPLGQADEAMEVSYLERGIAALQEVAGVTPVGYRAPMWELNYRSPEILHRYGFLYDSSLMDADHPYELSAGTGDEHIVEIPIHWAVDDWEQYCYIPGLFQSNPIGSPLHAREMWSAEFRATTDEGGCFALTGHPFLSGRPSRAAALGEVMAEAAQAPHVWVATMSEIARHTRSLGLAPRRLSPPTIDL